MCPCEPGKRERLDVLRINAQIVGGEELARWQSSGDRTHQGRVSHATATSDDLGGIRCEIVDAGCDGVRGQLPQGSLHVLRTMFSALSMRLCMRLQT